MPDRPSRRTRPTRPPTPPPEVQIGVLEKTVVLGLLALGIAVFWMLLSRQLQPRVVASPSPSPSPSASVTAAPATPAPVATPATGVPDLATIRTHFREDQPFSAVREVAQVLEGTTDIVVMDQALVELEQNMERMDRKVLYQVLDEYSKKASNSRQIQVGRYFSALMASKTFLFERYNMKAAHEVLDQLSTDRQSPVAPLALNKKAMLLVSQNPTQAISLFSRQLREFPDCPLNGFASLMIGTCYRALEQDRRALAQYEETLEKYKTAYGEGGLPLEPFVRHALADTMIKLGDKDGARKELARIVSSFKEYPYLNIIEETLQTLPAGGKG